MPKNEPIYVRLDINYDGLQGPSHIAELHPVEEGQYCRIGRILELSDGEAISGGLFGEHAVNMTAMPAKIVPHPSTYEEYDGVKATTLSRDEFEAFWSEASVMLPALFKK
ncbi:hypothetical protein [Corynebacterium aquilae]|uniref:hypothetical protein n=1 Tax=Corynebacterium aquilae TaxID=203263 RepID=UPI000952A232|nr:hypothetical protein [Corynebacterium aquilae]